jgi:hypothetical protein
MRSLLQELFAFRVQFSPKNVADDDRLLDANIDPGQHTDDCRGIYRRARSASFLHIRLS